MKQPSISRLALATATVASAITVTAVAPLVLEAAPGDTNTTSYTAANGDVPNPERGFHRGASVADSIDDSTTSVDRMTTLYNEGFRLVRVYIRLDDYRNKPLDAQLLNGLPELFDNARASGIKIIPRFSYNFGQDPDASVETIEAHLEQLTPLLRQNSDVIAVLQAGFIGAWGEWHGSSNGLTNPNDRARVRNALLDALPNERMAQFRYPSDLIEFDATPIGAAEAWSGSDDARTAHKNDCVMANENDAGTYSPSSRRIELRDHVEALTEFTAMGGETCQVSLGQQRVDCPTALFELENFHWDYLNIGFYGPTIDSWRGNCFDEIEQRLGYRYEMTEATTDTEVRTGDQLDVQLEITNDGFGKLYNPRPLNIVLVDESNGDRYPIQHSADARSVMPLGGETRTLDLGVTVPSNVPAGTYGIHVELPDGSSSLQDDTRYSIQFANNGTWNAAGGSNDLQLDVTVDGTAPPTTAPPVTEPPATVAPVTEPPVTVPPTTGPGVSDVGRIDSLVLVDSSTEQAVRIVSSGDVIALDDVGSQLSIRADVSGQVGSVRFERPATGQIQVESVAPYALAGDTNGDFNDAGLTVGTTTVSVTPFSGPGATGSVGTTTELTFEIVASTTTTSPPTVPPATTTPPVSTTETLAATADGYTQQGDLVVDGELRVEGGTRERVTYIRFEPAAVATPAEALLTLTIGSDSGVGTIVVRQTNGSPLFGDEVSDTATEVGSVTGSFTTGDVVTIPLSLIGIDGDGFDAGPLDLSVHLDSGGSADMSFSSVEGDQGPVLTLQS